MNRRDQRVIRVDCRRCKNCTGEECRLYGDDPVKAARNCAHDAFANYIPKERKKRKRKGGPKHGIDRKE